MHVVHSPYLQRLEPETELLPKFDQSLFFVIVVFLMNILVLLAAIAYFAADADAALTDVRILTSTE